MSFDSSMQLLGAFDNLRKDGQCDQLDTQAVDCLADGRPDWRSFLFYCVSMNASVIVVVLLFYMPLLILLFWPLDLLHNDVNGTLTPRHAAHGFNLETLYICLYNMIITMFTPGIPLVVTGLHAATSVNKLLVGAGLAVVVFNMIQRNFVLFVPQTVYLGIHFLVTFGSFCYSSGLTGKHECKQRACFVALWLLQLIAFGYIMFYALLPLYVTMPPTYAALVRLGLWPAFEVGYTRLIEIMTQYCYPTEQTQVDFALAALPFFMLLNVARSMVLSGSGKLSETILLALGSMLFRILLKLILFKFALWRIDRKNDMGETAKLRRRLILKHKTAQKFVVYNALELAFLVVVVFTPCVAGFRDHTLVIADLYQHAFVMWAVEILGLVLAWLILQRPNSIALVEWWRIVTAKSWAGVRIWLVWMLLFCTSSLVYPLFWAKVFRSQYLPTSS